MQWSCEYTEQVHMWGRHVSIFLTSLGTVFKETDPAGEHARVQWLLDRHRCGFCLVCDDRMVAL